MKKYVNMLAGALFIVIAMASCSKPKNLEVIPKNTPIVGTFDAVSLALKGDLANVEDLNIMQMMKQEVRTEDKEASDMMQDIISNPFSTGISLTQDIFVYALPEGQNSGFVCFALEMSSKDDFSTFLEKLMKQAKQPFSPQQKDGYSLQMMPNNEMAIAWDGDKILGCMPMDMDSKSKLEAKVAELMGLSDNISSEANFMNFYENKKDISVWLSYDWFIENLQGAPQIPGMSLNLKDMKGSNTGFYVDFQQNAISLSSKMYPSAELEKSYKENPPWGAGFNKELLTTIPEKNLAVLGGSMNTTYLGNLIKILPGAAQMDGQAQQQLGVGIDEILKSFKGSVAISVNDVKAQQQSYFDYYENIEKTREVPVPIASMVMDLNSKEILDKVKVLVPPSMLNEKSGYMQIPLGGMNNAFLFYNDKQMYVTNDEALIAKVAAGEEVEGSLSGTDIGDKLTEHDYYMNAKLNLEDYPHVVKNMLNEQSGGMVGRGLTAWNSFFDNLEFKQSKYDSELLLNLVSNDKNSLAHLLQTIDQNLGGAGPM